MHVYVIMAHAHTHTRAHTHTHAHTQCIQKLCIIYILTILIRDTELAQLPVGLLNTLKLKQPQVVARMIDILGEKILGGYTRMSSNQQSE